MLSLNRVLVAVSAMTVSGTAFAGDAGTHKLKFEWRSDFVAYSQENLGSLAPSTTNDPDGVPNSGDETTTGYKDEESGNTFAVARARLNLMGDVTDKTAYRVRFRVDTQALDYAYVDHKFTDMVKVRAGKQFAFAGGSIGLINGHDSYNLSSMYSADSVGRGGLPVYKTGMSVWLSPAKGQNIGLIALNGNVDHSMNIQSLPMLGFVYYGALVGGMVQPIFSVHYETIKEKTTTPGDTTMGGAGILWVSAGAKIETAGVHANLDVNYKSIGKQKQGDADEVDADTYLNFNVRLAYKTAQFQPVLQFYHTSETIVASKDSEAKNSRMGIAAAFEYFPEADNSDLRLHVGYAMDQFSPEDVDDKPTQSRFFLGFKMDIGYPISSGAAAPAEEKAEEAPEES